MCKKSESTLFPVWVKIWVRPYQRIVKCSEMLEKVPISERNRHFLWLRGKDLNWIAIIQYNFSRANMTKTTHNTVYCVPVSPFRFLCFLLIVVKKVVKSNN